MGAGGLGAMLARIAERTARWPALLRDAAAAGLAIASVCLGEALILVLPLHAEVLLAGPGLLLAVLLLGGASALFGLILAALAVGWMAAGRPTDLLGANVAEVALLLALSATLLGACIGARLWARKRERRAALLMDACARDALARIAAAEAQLAQARADTAAARRGAARDDGFDEALRREGGV